MADRSQHQKLRASYGTLLTEVAAILRRADPLELVSCGAPLDEYDEEVARIVAKLRTATSAHDVQVNLRGVFGGWREGPPDSSWAIDKVANEIWQFWRRQSEQAG